MELWDLYDNQRQKTGQTKIRGEGELLPGEYHLVVHVCLFNGRGELLIQQRQLDKEGWPGLWDVSVGGSAHSGETSQMAATRETAEELGYRRDMSGERPFFTVNFDGGFDDFYLLDASDLSLSDLILQEEEVRDVRWATMGDILKMREEGSFIAYQEGLIEMIFAMKEQRGAIRD